MAYTNFEQKIGEKCDLSEGLVLTDVLIMLLFRVARGSEKGNARGT